MELTQFKENREGRSASSRLAVIRRAALICVMLLVGVIALSAFIRQSQAGLGCADWPACYGERLRAAQQGAAAVQERPGVAAARLAHRLLGGAVLLVVLFVAMASLLTPPVLRREGGIALGMLLLVLALSVIGIVGGGVRVPAVTLGNLVCGFATLALAFRLATPGWPRLPAPLRAWAGVAAALVLAQVTLGGLVSASYAGLSCPSLTECMPDAPAWRALDPFREPVVDTSTLPVNPEGALAQALHRGLGALVIAALLPLGLLALRRGARGAGLALVALPLLQGALGVSLVVLGLPLAAALLHNLVAAFTFAVTLRLA